MLHNVVGRLAIVVLLAVVSTTAIFLIFDQRSRPLKISTAFPSVRSLPDPANIVTPAQWYLLTHLSSPLIQFDHQDGRFKPLLAESWSIEGATYRFKLKPNLSFSDGSPLTANDVASSFKRLMFRGTSTHFKLTEYFSSCPKLNGPSDPCDAIHVVDDHTIEFRLLKRFESFFLFLASPEGAIWPASKIDPTSGDLKMESFSGPYMVSHSDSNLITLMKNSLSPLIAEFPNAPDEIEIFISGSDPIALFKEKRIDLYIEMTRPFYERDFMALNLNRVTSSFNTILYLYKVGASQKQIGADYLSALWKADLGAEMVPASTFLPFGSLGALTEETFLSSLPSTSSDEGVKVAVPTPFFHVKMTEIFDKIARQVTPSVRFLPVPMAMINDLYAETPENPDEYDFVLTPYVASERYPSVQITFMLEGKEMPLSLEHIDAPDSSPERREELSTAQKWLLSSQWVVPLVFVRNQIITRENIELGDQPTTDAEIHLWRVQKRE